MQTIWQYLGTIENGDILNAFNMECYAEKPKIMIEGDKSKQHNMKIEVKYAEQGRKWEQVSTERIKRFQEEETDNNSTITLHLIVKGCEKSEEIYYRRKTVRELSDNVGISMQCFRMIWTMWQQNLFQSCRILDNNCAN